MTASEFLDFWPALSIFCILLPFTRSSLRHELPKKELGPTTVCKVFSKQSQMARHARIRTSREDSQHLRTQISQPGAGASVCTAHLYPACGLRSQDCRWAVEEGRALLASHCFTLLHIASHCFTLLHIASHCFTLLHIASHCFTLLHIASHCFTLLHIASQPKQTPACLAFGVVVRMVFLRLKLQRKVQAALEAASCFAQLAALLTVAAVAVLQCQRA